MRLKSVIVENFGSYECVELPVDNEGLCLIQGPTGSGKSTLCDIIPWILFGRTAKGGAVDEVLSWPGKKITKGIAIYDDGTNIVRTRGPKAKDNDLYHYIFDEENAIAGDLTRGKDLNDTQKIVNSLIGMDYDLYMAGSYYHEFSQTAQFFTTSAKNRRVLCEQLTDLSLATKLQPKLIEKYKFYNSERQQLESSKRSAESKVEVLQKMQQLEHTKADSWEKTKVARLEMLLMKSQEFDKSLARSGKCQSCGQVLPHQHKQSNPYTDQLESVAAETNPHTGGVKDYTDEIRNWKTELLSISEQLKSCELEAGNIETLQDCLAAYRAKAIEDSICILQSSTNNVLTEFFDAEIKVVFSVEDADKLDVTIHKDTNVCSFTQLSKGQRCLLKLSFGIAVMKSIKNYHNLDLNCAFFDEALEGLSEELKVKSYRLFETLIQDYGSVFVVEHSSELKAMFPNSYKVELINGESFIEKA